MTTRFALITALSLTALAPLSATAGGIAPEVIESDALQAATAANACGDAAIISASYNDAGQLETVCDDTVTGFVPLFGGLGAGAGLAALAGVGVIAAVAGGGDGGTNGTSGTN